jgi:hypothetical protein
MKLHRFGILAAILMFQACAGITVVPVTQGQDTEDIDGFRYYQTAPFLFIHTDGKGGVTSEIVWLPDQTRKMSIHPYSILASNNTTLKFTNGMLTEASNTVDETVVPNAILTALATTANLLKFGVPVPAPSGTQGTIPTPYLYKISIDKEGNVILSGGHPAIIIKATILRQAGAK